MIHHGLHNALTDQNPLLFRISLVHGLVEFHDASIDNITRVLVDLPPTSAQDVGISRLRNDTCSSHNVIVNSTATILVDDVVVVVVGECNCGRGRTGTGRHGCRYWIGSIRGGG